MAEQKAGTPAMLTNGDMLYISMDTIYNVIKNRDSNDHLDYQEAEKEIVESITDENGLSTEIYILVDVKAD